MELHHNHIVLDYFQDVLKNLGLGKAPNDRPVDTIDLTRSDPDDTPDESGPAGAQAAGP